MIGKVFELTSVVVNKMRLRVFIFKMGELISEELDGRILSNGKLNDFSCVELDDEKDIKTDKAEEDIENRKHNAIEYTCQ